MQDILMRLSHYGEYPYEYERMWKFLNSRQNSRK